MNKPEPTLTGMEEKAAAKIIGVKKDTLTKWRVRGRGPVYYRYSGMIRYHMRDIEAWLQSCRVDPAKRRRSRRRAK
jgi:hypothetical protein